MAVLTLRWADPPQSVWFCGRCTMILGGALPELLDRAILYHLGVEHGLTIRHAIATEEGAYGPASEWVRDG